MMEITGINIGAFAKDEYRGFVDSSIEGDDYLILGDNRTGKSLSLNAILYNLLGHDHTIDLATGRGNEVGITYSNGVEFHRGVPEAKYSDDSDEVTAKDARHKFRQTITDELSNEIEREDLIKAHFLHSHTERLPISDLKKTKLLGLIRSVITQKSQVELERHQRAATEIEAIRGEIKSKFREKEADLSDLRNEVRSARNELENYQHLFDLAQSGELQEIVSKLETEEEVRDQLSEVFQTQEGLRQEKRTLKKEKGRWERYKENEVNEVIAEAVFDFVCPVCEHHIEPEKAENRLKQGYCPFCGEERTLEELKEEIGDRIDTSVDRLDEILDRLDEINNELEELTDKEKQLKDKLPDIQELDSFVERQLRNNGYEVDGLAEEAREFIQENRVDIEESEERIDELESTVQSLRDAKEALSESKQIAKERVKEIKEDGRTHLDDFQAKWAEEYEQAADDLSLDIMITEEGEVVLPGNTDDRTYSQDGDLSDAEIRLLNLTFSVTLNHFAKESELTDWNVIILDEPFSNLDSDGSESLVEYIRGKEIQFIVTSSDEQYSSEFPKQTRLQKSTIQATFHQFN